MTIASARIASMFRAVSSSVSPLVTLDCAALTLITSAPRRLPASSNDVRVRVDDSKNRFTTVRPRSAARFSAPAARIASATSRRCVISPASSSSIPSKWRRFHMRSP